MERFPGDPSVADAAPNAPDVGSPDDAELAEIRARMADELLARSAAGSSSGRSPARPIELSSATVAPFVTEHPRAVIDVWAPWCGPCRAVAPVLERLAQELASDVAFGKVNADLAPGFAARWDVSGIPTLLLFERGRLVDRVVGALPERNLRERLRAVFGLSGGSATDASEPS